MDIYKTLRINRLRRMFAQTIESKESVKVILANVANSPQSKLSSAPEVTLTTLSELVSGSVGFLPKWQ
jgi:hypothetical protein